MMLDTIYRISGWFSRRHLIGWKRPPISINLKTHQSQNQTETESQTTFQFNGKEGICSETCKKLTRSRRNAAPATTKKEFDFKTHSTYRSSAFIDQSEFNIEIGIRKMMVLAITKISNTPPKNIPAAKLVSILKILLRHNHKIWVINRHKTMSHRTFGVTVSVSKMILSMWHW